MVHKTLDKIKFTSKLILIPAISAWLLYNVISYPAAYRTIDKAVQTEGKKYLNEIENRLENINSFEKVLHLGTVMATKKYLEKNNFPTKSL